MVNSGIAYGHRGGMTWIAVLLVASLVALTSCDGVEVAEEVGDSCKKDSDCPDPSPCQTGACSKGYCVDSIKDDYCLVETKCMSVGDVNTDDLCKFCDPTLSNTEFSVVQCEEGQQCTADKGCIWPAGSDCQNDDDCNPIDPCHSARCDQGKCLQDPDNEGTSCDDGVACTLTDVCDDLGACAGVPKDNECDDNDVCNGVEVCDAVDGCRNGNLLLCDDDDVCNGIESCDSVLGCTSGTALVCDDENECTTDSCTAGEIGCVNDPTTDPCDDGLACTNNDQCDGTGTCVGVVDETSNPLCDDGMWCNGLETCQPGHSDMNAQGCVTGDIPDPPIDVEPLDCMKVGECNEENDSYPFVPVLAGTVCNSGFSCEVNTTCNGAGTCSGIPIDSLCDNKIACDGTEICDPLLGCIDGTPVVCDDNEQCTEDKCVDGLCNYDANGANGLACYDGDDCTIDDKCADGACKGVGPLTCLTDYPELCGASLDDGCGKPLDCSSTCGSGYVCGTDSLCHKPTSATVCESCESDNNCGSTEICTYYADYLTQFGKFCAPDGNCSSEKDCPEGWACGDWGCWTQSGQACFGNIVAYGDNCMNAFETLDCAALGKECADGYCTPAANWCEPCSLAGGQALEWLATAVCGKFASCFAGLEADTKVCGVVNIDGQPCSEATVIEDCNDPNGEYGGPFTDVCIGGICANNPQFGCKKDSDCYGFVCTEESGDMKCLPNGRWQCNTETGDRELWYTGCNVLAKTESCDDGNPCTINTCGVVDGAPVCTQTPKKHGTACSDMLCIGSNYNQNVCDGKGGCQSVSWKACEDNFKCLPDKSDCMTECVDDNDCVPNTSCVGGSCEPTGLDP